MSLDTSHLRCLGCARSGSSDQSLTFKKKPASLFCESGHNYPILDGIPWIYADPAHQLDYWQQSAGALFQELEANLASHRQALGNAGNQQSAATAERLELLARAYFEQQNLTKSILSPLLKAQSDAPKLDWFQSQLQTPQMTQHLGAYRDLLFRDWTWGDETGENERALELVSKCMEGRATPDKFAVLGAGGGRLSYDLIRKWQPGSSTLIDINPMLLLAAKKMFAGEELHLYEFPIAPIDKANYAVKRSIKSPQKTDSTVNFLFADVAELPFPDQAFDVVLTPWLIDILEHDFAAFASNLSRLLPDGGTWLNFGTFNFASHATRRQYSLEELREIITKSGFELLADSCDRTPYLQSPGSGYHRTELVWSFAAVKKSDCKFISLARELPNWYLNHDDPIPQNAQWQSTGLANAIYSEVISLVDGSSSVLQIAEALEKSRGMPVAEGRFSVANFLRRLGT